MKILFLSRYFYPQIGGVEKHVLEISRILAKQGDTISIIAEGSNEKQIRKAQNSDFENNIIIHRMPFFKNGKFKKFQIWFWFFRNIKLFKNVDIIHVHDVFFWYLPFRFLFPRKKVFITFHGYETIFPPEKKAIFIRRLSRFLSNGTINIGNYINKWYKTPANFTIYGGAENKNFWRNQNNDSGNLVLKIIFIGRIEKDNGIEIYSQILEKLKNKKIKFKFMAIGDGNLRFLFEKYGQVTGFANKVEKYLKNSDLVFASSYLSILEAFAFKKLVISIWQNDLKKDYLETPFSNFLIKGNDSKNIVNDFLNLKIEEKNKMIESAFSYVEKNTWEDVVKIYKRLWSCKF